MTLHVVAAADVGPTPWRNGGGITRELVAWPSPEAWIARVSVADIVADGPFSAFPGVDRWFAVLEGDGVELTHDGGAPVRLRTGDAIHRFRGETATQCRLPGGATRDFNLMVKRDTGAAVVTPLAAVPAAGSDWSACFAATPLRIRLLGDAQWHALPERSLAWTATRAHLEIDAPAGARGWRIGVLRAGAAR